MANVNTDFSAFMAGNTTDEIIDYVASTRFKVKNKPVAWQLKGIESELDERLRKESTNKVAVPGKRGQYTQEIDADKYMAKVCVASVVYPNLNDAALQDSYGVKTPDALLKKLLKPGEYTALKAKVMEINGYDVGMDDLVDEAKN